MKFPDDVPVLTDGIVTLRAHTPGDVDGIVEQCADPVSIRWTTVPVPYTVTDAERWVTSAIPSAWADGSDLGFAIETADEQGVRRFAGSTSLRPEGNDVAEIAYGLAAWARGRGVMSRALNLLLDWGFEQHDLSVVIWRANVGNFASWRVAWANGFSFDGTVKRLLVQRGERYDAWVGSLRRGDSREPQSTWFDVPVLETARLRLRPWREDDGVRLLEAANDDRLRHFIPETPLPRSLEAVPAYLTRVRLAEAHGTRIAWCVADRGTDQALGNVALFEFEGSADERTAQVGYWAHPDARGCGVIAEAVRLVSDWAIAAEPPYRMRRLYLLTAASNSAARRVAEQAGFTHVGTERCAAPVGGKGFDDNALYDRLDTD